ncbi:ferric reductase-like transmembrane domain-containing protein [Acetobacter sp.]|jgi:predicted ferric reductase|uniref:ferric reductase-like transmembrane domain-containing protein n=1 Tax=Acetobacter sp. TaxID=440 RepID=UPI0025C4C9DC|nr:ferric reductase-like transmembrane domain-containing protein [Acetobacter sp.]MCH4092147.1 ferric reductase-like transmembrane domain-containing protein [Acetobacter sp.]MCI1299936.1 ferric reductase-like transmembrane domain-containing protein [Acetobacter sp.]MCI1315954.1 ferric reductase-like transmembrane domain-containing protein [Acetobacter sp.]
MPGWIALAALLALLCTAFLLVCVFAAGQPGTAGLWDVTMIGGYSALFALFQMFFLTGRPLDRPVYEGRFFLRLHEYTAYLILLLVIAHVIGGVWAEPLLWRDIWPPVLPVMQTGALASLLLVILAVVSQPRWKLAVFRNARIFRYCHYGLAAILLCVTGLHAWQAGFRIATPALTFSLVGMSALALAVPLLVRALPVQSRRGEKRLRNTAALAVPVVIILGCVGLLVPVLCAMWLNR